jgi:hypothetical protein
MVASPEELVNRRAKTVVVVQPLDRSIPLECLIVLVFVELLTAPPFVVGIAIGMVD